MLRYIFKNYDQFLESIRTHSTKFFSSKNNTKNNHNLQMSPIDVLDLEIKKLEAKLDKQEDVSKKREISKIILYLRLKQKSLSTTNKYIKRAQDILRDEVDDSAYEALDYLKRVPKNLSSKELNEIYTYKAYIHELLEEFEDASSTFKEAIKYDKTPHTLSEYREFVERSRRALSWGDNSIKENLSHSTSSIHKITKIEDMPEVIDRLENIAKYYARSPKSRTLAKKYFREVLKMYEILVEHNPKKFTCKYIKALLDAVEFFMMPASLLQDVQELLKNPQNCIESRVYLLERAKELKQKNYIKKSIGYI